MIFLIEPVSIIVFLTDSKKIKVSKNISKKSNKYLRYFPRYLWLKKYQLIANQKL